jgi:hypothetical protein
MCILHHIFVNSEALFIAENKGELIKYLFGGTYVGSYTYVLYTIFTGIS